MTAEAGNPASEELNADEEHFEETAGVFRLVRWLAVAIVVPRFILLVPPGGKETPWDPAWTGVVLLGLLVTTNVLSSRAGVRGLHGLVFGAKSAVLLDSIVVLLATLTALYEGRQPGVVMLMIPIYEASAYFGLRAAAITSLGTGGSFFVGARLLADAASNEGDPELLVYQLGAMLLVVLLTGILAERTARQMRRVKRQAIDADRRSDLLKIAAVASRSLGTLQDGHVLDAVLSGAIQLGFDAVDLFMVDDAGAWSLAGHVGLPSAQVEHPGNEAGLVGEVRARGHTVVIDRASEATTTGGEGTKSGIHLAAGVPVWRAGEVVGVLGAGTLEARHVLPAEIECLELLAAHAGAAFEASRHLDETRGLEDRLAYEVSHDHLTGLPNRAWFLESLHESLREGVTAVLVCDLDRFKTINDSLGHKMGDSLLDAVAARLLSLVGSNGMVARIGADEFAIQLHGTTAENAMNVAGAILQGFATPFAIEGEVIVVTFSIGVATSEDSPSIEATTLLRDADLAMYGAKRAGRSRFELFDLDLRARARRRMETETELRRALTGGGLHVAYQPVVSLATGAIVSVEALARWQHPVHGSVDPDEFIPLAEETGLIWDLGREVLTQACHEARGWQHFMGEHAPRIGVNLSAVQLEDPGCVEMVLGVLQQTGLAPSRLVLEITEGVVMNDSVEVLESVIALAALGVRLAVDDFGKGWSSLSYLARYPLSELKIDRCFIEGVTTRPADRAIVASVVQLAHELGLVVVAEGIEHRSQLDELLALGCDEGQGFHLHRPLTPLAMSSLLQRLVT
ncbi:MAG: GGDEF domain-containing protein [Actinobacteria bacterium]|nr:GGDEF domain-containing protein [Actinomycetota bacterium]